MTANVELLIKTLDHVRNLPIAPMRRDKKGNFMYLLREKEVKSQDYYNPAVFYCPSGKPPNNANRENFEVLKKEAGISADFLSWAYILSGRQVDLETLFRNPSSIKKAIVPMLGIDEKTTKELNDHNTTLDEIEIIIANLNHANLNHKETPEL